MYDTINDYMENPNMDPSQINDLLEMSNDFRNSQLIYQPLFCQLFKEKVSIENDLPF
jgi:hypothetical protein